MRALVCIIVVILLSLFVSCSSNTLNVNDLNDPPRWTSDTGTTDTGTDPKPDENTSEDKDPSTDPDDPSDIWYDSTIDLPEEE